MLSFDLFQGLMDGLGLVHGIRVGNIHHVEEQVGFGNLLQGGSEGGHQRGG